MAISLVNVAKYFRNEPQQVEALEFLQGQIPESTLEEFATIFRRKPPKPQSPVGKIVARCEELGIELNHGSSKSHYRVNIVGLEGCNPDYTLNNDRWQEDKYNDLIVLIGVNSAGKAKILGEYKATTEPGIYYTKNRLNRAGAARVTIDTKHKGIWQLGAHKKQYPALIQTGNKICVARDGNNDFSRAGDVVQCGWFGINFHWGTPGRIGRWSAGCQVVEGKSNHQAAMKIILADKQTRYDYILLDASKIF